jgi:cation transport protein ChaC
MNPNDCSSNLWVFGYGSLCWLQGFDYGSHQLGFIRGFSRKFWQGNNSHRGTADKVSQVSNLARFLNFKTLACAFLGNIASSI